MKDQLGSSPFDSLVVFLFSDYFNAIFGLVADSNKRIEMVLGLSRVKQLGTLKRPSHGDL
jgi:hypothetical protein